jgi:hypothetical protein
VTIANLKVAHFLIGSRCNWYDMIELALVNNYACQHTLNALQFDLDVPTLGAY